MNITGTKSYVQVEDDDGNIARFDGETCLGNFYAYADYIHWIRHKGEPTDKDRIDLIYKATQYGKNNDTKILFFDVNDKVMFETELRLKTEAYRSKTYYAFMVVMVSSLFFGTLLLAVLDETSPTFNMVINIAVGLIAAPFLFYGFLVWRFKVVAEGDAMTVIPGLGRKYSFHTSEITRIIRKTKMDFGWEVVEKVRIYTKHKHVSLNRNMEGLEEMDAFLKRHVAQEKVITKLRR